MCACCSLAVLTACTSYPLGFSKSEWDALPPKKQAEFRALQKIKDGDDRRDAEQTRQAVDTKVQQIEQRNRDQPSP